MLRLIGLGVRARTVVVGVEQVRMAAKKGNLLFAVVARDASANSREKVVPLLRARRVNFVMARRPRNWVPPSDGIRRQLLASSTSSLPVAFASSWLRASSVIRRRGV